MAKVVTIGSVSKDMFFPTSEGTVLETPDDVLSQKKLAFEMGAKYHVEERFEALGGCSVNVAVGIVKLGEAVSCYTTIGDDSIGRWIAKELRSTNVGLEYLHVVEQCKSDLSMILVDTRSAERIIFSNQVANQKLIFDGKKIGTPHWIFIGDLSGDWQKTIDDVLHFVAERKSFLAFNPRQKTIHQDVGKVLQAIAKTQMLFVNKDEAMEIIMGMGEITVKELLDSEEYLVKMLYRLGAKIVALTDGERGAWVFDGKKLFHAEALLREAKDTTGAGDAFTSGFFASHLKRHDLATSLRWGIANSANSVGEYGGQRGLLDENEITEIAKTVNIDSLN